VRGVGRFLTTDWIDVSSPGREFGSRRGAALRRDASRAESRRGRLSRSMAQRGLRGRDDEIQLAPLEQHVVATANDTKVWFACPSEGRGAFREMALLA
jgi:hypothetical protein